MASYRRPAVILVSLGAVRVFPLASSKQTFAVCLNRTCLVVGVLMFNLSVLWAFHVSTLVSVVSSGKFPAMTTSDLLHSPSWWYVEPSGGASRFGMFLWFFLNFFSFCISCKYQAYLLFDSADPPMSTPQTLFVFLPILMISDIFLSPWISHLSHKGLLFPLTHFVQLGPAYSYLKFSGYSFVCVWGGVILGLHSLLS